MYCKQSENVRREAITLHCKKLNDSSCLFTQCIAYSQCWGSEQFHSDSDHVYQTILILLLSAFGSPTLHTVLYIRFSLLKVPNPWSKEGMEWKQWFKCVVLYWSHIVYKGVEGEGRGCERLRIEQ